jgi:predicted RNA binding protein YcfA (HicA-like mRNA interferase family)
MMTAKEVIRLIERRGGVLLRQRGSHRHYETQAILADGTEATARTTVTYPAGDIRPGTLRAIERDLKPVFGKGLLRGQ